MKLFIDSTNNTQTIIRLNDREYVRKVDSPHDQDVFGFLLSCLDKEGVKPEDITDIEVNPGPGSFTGTRVGVSIANVLGFALDIDVNGSSNPVEPIYSAPPAITLKNNG